MTQSPDTTATAPKPKALRYVLVASLALNLAVVGLFAGMALHHGGFGPDRDGVRDLGFGPFTEALDEGDRAALRKADFVSTRGAFKFGTNQHPIQDIYVREVVKEGDVLTNKIIGTAMTDRGDAYADQCKM